jgi:Carboxypeptidase regulatory-like domain/Matrixin
MKHLRILALALGAVLLTGAPSLAFVLTTDLREGKLVHLRWRTATFPVPFVMSDRPLQLLSNLARDSTLASAVLAAMSVWELGPVGMRLNGTVASPELKWDGVNLITFVDTPRNRDVSANYYAVTFSTRIYPSDGRARIVDSDVVFNPKELFATDERFNAVDVQGLMTHELGHALGLGHSPICSATMWPHTSPGDTWERTLAPGDLAGLRALYEIDTEPSCGTISGRVLTVADAPVFGAHVTCTDSEGVICVGGITDWDGNFTLPSLPAGTYRVYAQPLNGAFTPDNLTSAFKSDSQHPVLRDFLTTFAGGNRSPTSVTVTAGQTTALDPIRVATQAPNIIPRYWSWRWDTSSSWKSGALPIQIPPGSRIVLGIKGEGMSVVSAFSASFSGSDVRIEPARAYTDTSNNGEWLVFPIAVREGARPGARSLDLVRGQEHVILSGLLEITEP